MGRAKTKNMTDPATGRALPTGVQYRGPLQYRVRPLVDGVRVTKTLATAKEATAYLEALRTDIRRGDYVDTRSLDSVTVGQLVQRFEIEFLQSDGLRRGADEDRGHSAPLKKDIIGQIKLSKLSPAEIYKFMARQRAAGLAPGTILKRVNLLARILKVAKQRWEYPIRVNVASAAEVERPPGADVKRERILGPSTQAQRQAAIAHGFDPAETEEAILLQALESSEFKWDAAITRWGLMTAFRLGESWTLHWEDIDFDQAVVRVYGRARKGPKGTSNVPFETRPLLPNALTFLSSIRPNDTPEGSRVFPIGGTQQAFSMRFTRNCRKVQIHDFHYHDCRHCATTELAEIYPNPLELMKSTGHKELRSVQRYYNKKAKDISKDAAKRLQDKVNDAMKN